MNAINREPPKLVSIVVLAKSSDGRINQVALSDDENDLIVSILMRDGSVKCLDKDISHGIGIEDRNDDQP